MLPPLPTLFAATPVNLQTVARLGETVIVSGVRLAGTTPVAVLSHRLLDTPIEIPVAVNDPGTEFVLTLPNDAGAQTAFAPGLWQVSLRVTPTGELNARETNGVALPIAADPVIVSDAGLGLPAVNVVRSGVPPHVTATLATRPQVRVEQRASLALDGTVAEASAHTAAADPLVFVFPNTVAAGDRWVRVRVDGVDSPLLLRTGPVPVYDPTQKLTVPA
jgi:hypothetical protein